MRLFIEQTLPALPEQTVRIPFELNSQTGILRARVDYELDNDPDNNELCLEIGTISRQFQQTTEEQLEFNGAVMFAVSQGEEQRSYQEMLTLVSPKTDHTYFAGEGIEAGIQYHYVNECAAVINWACKPDTALINVEAKADF